MPRICSNKVFLFPGCLVNLTCGMLFVHLTVLRAFLPNVEAYSDGLAVNHFLLCSLSLRVKVGTISEVRHILCVCLLPCCFLFDLLIWISLFYSEEVSL